MLKKTLIFIITFIASFLVMGSLYYAFIDRSFEAWVPPESKVNYAPSEDSLISFTLTVESDIQYQIDINPSKNTFLAYKPSIKTEWYVRMTGNQFKNFISSFDAFFYSLEKEYSYTDSKGVKIYFNSGWQTILASQMLELMRFKGISEGERDELSSNIFNAFIKEKFPQKSIDELFDLIIKNSENNFSAVTFKDLVNISD